MKEQPTIGPTRRLRLQETPPPELADLLAQWATETAGEYEIPEDECLRAVARRQLARRLFPDECWLPPRDTVPYTEIK